MPRIEYLRSVWPSVVCQAQAWFLRHHMISWCPRGVKWNTI